MLLAPVEQAFRRYRSNGDPSQLRIVFDATADELLSIARHLASREAEAEDLVQATFLTAMQAAAQYDPRQRVLPWLVGILANQARMARRRSRRAVDPDRLPERAAPDPVRDAAASELSQALDQTIEDLPDAYRPVLRLYFEKGLRPVEIADALERPQGTVRAQISRGLAQVRRSLPAGWIAAPAGAAAAGAGRGLKALRAVVLDAAREQRGPVSAGPVGSASGGWRGVSRTWGVGAAGAVALVTLGWVGLQLSGGDPAGTGATTEAARPAAADSTLVVDSARRALPAAEASAGAAAGPGAGGASAPMLHVRVVHADDGRPAANLGVYVVSAASMPEVLAHALTDADGLARLRDLDVGSATLRLDRCSVEWPVPAPEQRSEPIELALPRGLRVEGRVLSSSGAPVPNARVWGRDASMWVREVARADDEGRYAVADAESCFEFWARAPDAAASAPASAEGLAGATVGLDLHLRDRAPVLRGRVLAPDGRARAGAHVVALARTDGGTHVSRTDADGAFAFAGLAPGRHVLLAWCDSDDLGQGRAEVDLVATAAAAAPTTQADVTLPRAATVVGIVLSDGVPCAGWRITAWPDAEPERQAVAKRVGPRTAFTGADGRFELSGLTPVRHRLRVRSGRRDGGWAEVRVRLAEGERRSLDLQLDRSRRLCVHVRAVNGVTLRGVSVALVAPGRDGVLRVQASRRADDAGTVCFQDLDATVGREVFVLARVDDHPDNAVVLARRADIEPGVDLDVIVGRSELPNARIAGRLVDPQGAPRSAVRVIAAPTAHPRIGRIASKADADGRFALGPLPAGRYALLVRVGRTAPVSLGEFDLAPAAKLDLGELVAPRRPQ
ncbi:MAG: sigma-70 family RNA polymerase sigma factor [Planctomycetota bacterium]